MVAAVEVSTPPLAVAAIVLDLEAERGVGGADPVQGRAVNTSLPAAMSLAAMACPAVTAWLASVNVPAPGSDVTITVLQGIRRLIVRIGEREVRELERVGGCSPAS